jgi:hypothetical protein
MPFDPAIADQLSQMTLAAAQNSLQLNSALDRNSAAASNAVLTLGVQLQQLAGLNKETSIDPMEAAAAANIRSSQDPSHIAGLQTAHRAPMGRQGGE